MNGLLAASSIVVVVALAALVPGSGWSVSWARERPGKRPTGGAKVASKVEA